MLNEVRTFESQTRLWIKHIDEFLSRIRFENLTELTMTGAEEFKNQCNKYLTELASIRNKHTNQLSENLDIYSDLNSLEMRILFYRNEVIKNSDLKFQSIEMSLNCDPQNPYFLYQRFMASTLGDDASENDTDYSSDEDSDDSSNDETADYTDLLQAKNSLMENTYRAEFEGDEKVSIAFKFIGKEILAQAADYYVAEKDYLQAGKCYSMLITQYQYNYLLEYADCEMKLFNWKQAEKILAEYLLTPSKSINGYIKWFDCLQKLGRGEEIQTKYLELSQAENLSDQDKSLLYANKIIYDFYQLNLESVITKCNQIIPDMHIPNEKIYYLLLRTISHQLQGNTVAANTDHEEAKNLIVQYANIISDSSNYLELQQELNTNLLFFYLAEVLLGKSISNKNWESSISELVSCSQLSSPNEFLLQMKIELLLLIESKVNFSLQNLKRLAIQEISCLTTMSQYTVDMVKKINKSQFLLSLAHGSLFTADKNLQKIPPDTIVYCHTPN